MSYEIYLVSKRRLTSEITEKLYDHSVLEKVSSKLRITVIHNNMLIDQFVLINSIACTLPPLQKRARMDLQNDSVI